MNAEDFLKSVRLVGDLSSHGIFVFDYSAAAVKYVNHALVEIFDISHNTFSRQPEFFINRIDKQDLELVHSRHEELLKARKVENLEFRIIKHDNSTRYLGVDCYLVSDSVVYGIVRDITGQREHENYIIDYGGKKNTMLDMVTHNLSAPLNLSVQLLKSLQKPGLSQENFAPLVRLVKENTEQCIQLVNEFLEEEHMVSQHIYVKRNRIDLLHKLATVIERFEKSYPEHKFTLLHNNNDLSITNDDVKLLQVINNLLSNAVKWSPDGSEIQVRITEASEIVTIEIIDRGVGIPKEMLPLIFSKHTPAARPGLKGQKSLGIGLYITHKLVTLMGGTISVESVVNKGSTFTVELPR